MACDFMQDYINRKGALVGDAIIVLDLEVVKNVEDPGGDYVVGSRNAAYNKSLAVRCLSCLPCLPSFRLSYSLSALCLT